MLGIGTPAIANGLDDAISVQRDDTAVGVIDCCHESPSKACRQRHAHSTPELLAPKQTEPEQPLQIAHSYLDLSSNRFLSNDAFSELHRPLVGNLIYLTTLRLRL